MPTEVTCPQCGQSYKVKPELAGKKLRCRECAAILTIPADDLDDFEGAIDVAEEAPPTPKKRRAAALPEAPQVAAKKSPKSSRKRGSSGGMSSGMKWLLGLTGGALVVGLLCCGGVSLALWRVGHQFTGAEAVPAGQTFDQWRAGLKTELLRTGPAPQEYDDEELPENVTQVMYPSGDLQLKALLYQPPEVTERRPALVFFHGGFALGVGDLTEACRPFMEAGYVVLAPAFRGENGNPGNYELFLGEVDDARAAVQWLHLLTVVATNGIYTFGHSIGGGVSAVLGLLDNVPIRHGGSSGGLYDHTTFLVWQIDETVPFKNSPKERSVRLLHGNVKHLQHPHYAYVGIEDVPFDESVTAMSQEPKGAHPLVIERVPGDHFSSFDESIRRYLKLTQQER